MDTQVISNIFLSFRGLVVWLNWFGWWKTQQENELSLYFSGYYLPTSPSVLWNECYSVTWTGFYGQWTLFTLNCLNVKTQQGNEWSWCSSVCAPVPPAVCQLCVIVFSMYHLFPSAEVGCLFTMTTAAVVNLSLAARAVAFTADRPGWVWASFWLFSCVIGVLCRLSSGSQRRSVISSKRW